MKGRARPPSSPESEESWTVDCPCGVNYDDGEEMVDCDECGVWVHTGCCRILKGHTSYVCDKCKFKKKKESEESEVAQLLVELPSKTPPLEEKVFTLRSELSREERAHVHGIPGGDPSFFVGVSPVFSRQLWKYTGYVPKVFQFNYSDIPQEKTNACVLFAQYAETKTESPTFDYAKGEHQIEEGKLVITDLLPLGETHADKYYFSKEKHSKRDSRKETKHRLREQQEDYLKSHYHSKRRRDENSKKDFTSKKRSKNFGVDDYQGTPRRAYDEATIPLKSARIASRNMKAYSAFNSVEEADAYAGTAYNNNTKVEELAPRTFGFNSRETGGAIDSSFRKQLATKAARKGAPVSCVRNDHEDYSGSHRSVDTVTHQETHSARKEQDVAARNKFSAIKHDGDASKSWDHFGSSGFVEGKAGSIGHPHITLADVKENSLRSRSNLIVSNKDHLDETLLEQHPSPVTEKLGKQQRSNDDVNLAARQQIVLHKQAEHYSANASDDEERPLSVRVANESHAADSPHVSADDQDYVVRASQQNLAPLLPSLPTQDASLQDADVASPIFNKHSKGVVESLQAVFDDSIKLSPKSFQTGPSRSADFSSPTLSGPGVDSKQPGSMKVDSVSPPSERTPNTFIAQPIPYFKTYVGSPPTSNDKAPSSLAAKGGIHANSNSTSKFRSKAHDMKKADVGSGDLNEASTNLSSHRDAKELSKVAGSGKSLATRAMPHQKASKQSGQLLDALDQSLPQNKHSSKLTTTSLPHKSEKAGLVAGSKSTTLLLSPNHASTTDVPMQGMDSTRPAMNDEELALLLHQELNSSPRVARVARVRQGGAGAHPFSTKRSTTQKDPHMTSRRKSREEHGEVARGADELSKAEVSGGPAKQDTSIIAHCGGRKDKDTPEVLKVPPAMAAPELNRHLSPGSGVHAERQPHSDSFGATDTEDGERRTSADSIVTLPGLIEDILNEKGANASYDLICEEVLPHWSKLRKHNGERYAYTSHRQAVLDCLRNRSAWSHLIDRGPKTNLGRKRRRLDSAVGSESEHAEQSSHLNNVEEDHVLLKVSKEESEVGPSESWQLSDSNKDADLSLPEEVPKGKRKARRGRRLTSQSRGYGARAHHGRGERVGEFVQGMDDDYDHMVSPYSEEPASSSEDEEIYVHRGAGRHITRHRGSSVDSDDDDDADL